MTPHSTACRALLAQTAKLIALDPEQARQLVDGAPFKFASGLRARFLSEQGPAAAVRTKVLLGLPAGALAGDDVVRFIALQTAFASDGNWQLGMGPDGQLELTAQEARDSAPAVATDLHMGCVAGWMTLRVLLNEPIDGTGEQTGAGSRHG